jgi:hypothetical protein
MRMLTGGHITAIHAQIASDVANGLLQGTTQTRPTISQARCRDDGLAAFLKDRECGKLLPARSMDLELEDRYVLTTAA